MTLNISFISEGVIGVAADRRFTKINQKTGEVIDFDDKSNKSIKVIAKDGILFITFTGLGVLKKGNSELLMSDWISECIYHLGANLTIDNCIKSLFDAANVDADYFYPNWHSFYFVGHKNPQGNFLCSVSNFEKQDNFNSQGVRKEFRFYSSPVDKVLVSGQTIVENDKLFKKRLNKKLKPLIKKAKNLGEISKELGRLIQIAAKINKSVSEESMVMIATRDGVDAVYYPKNINDGFSYLPMTVQDIGNGIIVVGEGVVDTDESRVGRLAQELLKDNSTQIFPDKRGRILLRLKKESDNK